VALPRPLPPRPLMSRRIHPLVFVLLVIIGVKVSEQLYRWVAYADERDRVRVFRGQLLEAGAAIVRTREESDSMRAVMRAEDTSLEEEQVALRRYNRYSRGGTLPPEVYARYKEELDSYNLHVSERNAKLGDWQEILARNHLAVSRYNLLADSVRDLAARMGEPYYAVPTPAEAAVELRVQREPIRPEP